MTKFHKNKQTNKICSQQKLNGKTASGINIFRRTAAIGREHNKITANFHNNK